jgi:hypothetical protein
MKWLSVTSLRVDVDRAFYSLFFMQSFAMVAAPVGGINSTEDTSFYKMLLLEKLIRDAKERDLRMHYVQ